MILSTPTGPIVNGDGELSNPGAAEKVRSKVVVAACAAGASAKDEAATMPATTAPAVKVDDFFERSESDMTMKKPSSILPT